MEDTVQIYAPNLEGEYTVHNVSFSEVYNRLKDKETTANQLPRATDFGPNYGLLSECLTPSPVIHSILSASIRCDTDDRYVVFVGERHIELRRLTERLNLELLASKTDFFCKIRAAGLIDIKKGSSSSFLDQIKQEERDSPFPSSSRTPYRIPKQVVVLALESGDLAFIYIDVTAKGKLDFVVSTLKIPPEQPKVSHIGKHISVDSHSRAMAVCAWQDSFRLYEIHNAETMVQKMANGQSFIPLRHERTFQVPGTLLHLEFLRANDPELVVFMVLFVNKLKQSRLLLFEWNTNLPLSRATQLGQDGLRLPDKWGLPLHIVPLTIPTFFALINEHAIYVGKAADITSGNCRWKNFPIPMASPRDNRLVTSWARPYRNAGYAQRNDDFYIVKENGELFWIYVNNNQSSYGPGIETVGSGRLTGAVGTAFTFHEARTESSSDLLVAAGEASAGGTYLITPKRPNTPSLKDPLFIQEIFNWSPMFDADILNLKGSDRSHLSTPRGRMFACTGFGEHGAVAEIRHGIECRPATDIENQDPVTKLIPLHGDAGRGCFVLLCLVLGTSLWYLPYNTLDPSDAGDVVSLRIGENVKTLAAKVVNGRCVQVTTDGVYSTVLDEADVESDVQVPSPGQEWDCPSGYSIVAAALRDDMLVLVVKCETGHQLWSMALLPISGGDQDKFLMQQGGPIDITSQPTFLDFLEIGEQIYLVVENAGSTLDFYAFHTLGILTPRVRLATSEGLDLDARGEAVNTQAQSPVCESVCLLESQGRTFLLCGLRNGYVFYGKLDIETLDFKPVKRVRIGRLPVLLSKREGSCERVLAQSTHSLHQISIENSELVVAPIIFNQAVEPSIEAVCHLNHDFRSTQFPDPIICATDTSIIVAMLGRMPAVCTRQLEVRETPSKLLYIEKEDLLAVVCLRPGPLYNGLEDGKKASPSTILFLDPTTGEAQSSRDLRDSKYSDLIFNKRNEKIHCLCNWTFPDRTVVWNCILVGTSYQSSEDQPRKGRILVLSIKYNKLGSEKRLEIRKRNQISCPEPVYSLATYGESSIIYGSERTLSKIELVRNTLGQWKFEGLVTHSVSSTPTQITVQEEKNLIWVSSTRDALTVYRFNETPSPSIQRLYSDEKERAGRSHVQIEESFFLTTDRDEGLIGLWMPPDRRTNTNFIKTFEAYLPNSIATLRSGDLRAPWRPRNLSLPGIVRPDIDIIGTCFDGSMYHFTILDSAATNLLVYLQNSYLRVVYPKWKSKPMHRREHEMTKEGTIRHVHGGIIAQALEGGLGWLDEVVRTDEGVLDGLMVELFRGRGMEFIRGEMSTGAVLEMYLSELLNGVVL
ncbi:hypothetical protein H072_2539 [Dactylellina haptotyla CBS 200.50]|uniref:Cleavage/polyadenylation specificity factor A subunit N-terminal domain-containing protein n=1 Tax=Dactylellina haptotyla (strain CBS 200.50) TaxID=1284197 RepID=S8C713_DACHA|nr:hypothetical protein H072_2539 [Dactylellina haptotyla CBS 200.50]